MTCFIALLRGINVGGRNKVPMAELRSHLEADGLQDVQTHIQSGNVVFASSKTPTQLEHSIEAILHKRFGVDAPAMVRNAAQWEAQLQENPFLGAAKERPNQVVLCLAKETLPEAVASIVQGKAAGGERVERCGEALWVDYVAGIGRSKITPAVLDRAAGSPVTARNWKTATRLAEIAAGNASTRHAASR